jgi:hypothetical protein
LALLLIAAALLGLASSSAHALCAPGLQCCTGADNSGSPACGGDGVASLGNDSGTELGAGNPINLLNGNKFQREIDMAPLPGVLGLELVRYYNSAEPRVGWLGRGWRLSYESQLSLRGELEIAQADGTRVKFNRSAQDPDTLHPLAPSGGARRAPARRHRPHWTWADGRGSVHARPARQHPPASGEVVASTTTTRVGSNRSDRSAGRTAAAALRRPVALATASRRGGDRHPARALRLEQAAACPKARA